jgi:hypothetical protein
MPPLRCSREPCGDLALRAKQLRYSTLVEQFHTARRTYGHARCTTAFWRVRRDRLRHRAVWLLWLYQQWLIDWEQAHSFSS